MCGIAGYYLAPDDTTTDVVRLLRNLHIQIDVRGGDATGAAWSTGRSAPSHVTVTGNARQFRLDNPEAGKGSRLGILHTRFATQGSEYDQVNNHPVRSGPVLLTHNGVIQNDYKLFHEYHMERVGDVDSEVIAALLARAWSGAMTHLDALSKPAGNMAVAWLNVKEPDVLHLARGHASPLTVAQLRNGTFLYASTKPLLLDAIRYSGIPEGSVDFVGEVKEGTYMRVHDGRLTTVENFEPTSYQSTAASYRSLYGASWFQNPAWEKKAILGPSRVEEDWDAAYNEEVRRRNLDPSRAGYCDFCDGLEHLDGNGLCEWCALDPDGVLGYQDRLDSMTTDYAGVIGRWDEGCAR